MKLIIANKVYSSWSLRGWLAAKQSGLPFEEHLIPMYGHEWEAEKRDGLLTPSAGKAPLLIDGDAIVWDTLAILEYLADKVGRDRFWPKPDDARALARAMVAEMHSSYAALRNECTMNVRKVGTPKALSEAAEADVKRILTLWAEARARYGHGGPFLFGAFCAADIFYAPVVTRFRTYQITVPGFAEAYIQAVWEHTWMQEWVAAAQEEPWVIQHYEDMLD